MSQVVSSTSTYNPCNPCNPCLYIYIYPLCECVCVCVGDTIKSHGTLSSFSWRRNPYGTPPRQQQLQPQLQSQLQLPNLLRFVRQRLWLVPKRIFSSKNVATLLQSLTPGRPLQPLELPPPISTPTWHLACQPILHILLFIINFRTLPRRLPLVRRATSRAAAATSPRRFQFSGCQC